MGIHHLPRILMHIAVRLSATYTRTLPRMVMHGNNMYSRQETQTSFGIAQWIKNAPNIVNPSYGPITYRLEVEGMSILRITICLSVPSMKMALNGAILEKICIWKTQKLPHDRYGNVSVEFTAPVWSKDAGERVEFWYVGVFQDGSSEARRGPDPSNFPARCTGLRIGRVQ